MSSSVRNTALIIMEKGPRSNPPLLSQGTCHVEARVIIEKLQLIYTSRSKAPVISFQPSGLKRGCHRGSPRPMIASHGLSFCPN